MCRDLSIAAERAGYSFTVRSIWISYAFGWIGAGARSVINLNDIHYFVRVVDMKGFAAAERVLNVPKSTLSKRVAALEKALDVCLINRSTRRFAVTEIGEVFYRHAVATLVEAEAAEDAVRRRLAEPVGVVRITASVGATRNILADILPDLVIAYPKIQVTLQTTDQVVDLVQDGFDVAVRNHFRPLPDSGLVQKLVREEKIVVVASPSYIRCHGHPAVPDKLSEHQALVIGPSRGSWPDDWLLQPENGAPVCVTPSPRFVANELTALLNAAIAGAGIACLPMSLCGQAFESGQLVRILPHWTVGNIYTTLLTPYRRGQLPSVRAVIDFLAAKFALSDLETSASSIS